MVSMKKARALKSGDTIGIAASASPFNRQLFLKGTSALKRLGFNTFYRHDIFDQNRYLAGTDQRRAEEFMELVQNRDISAIMFARGGYGSQRVITRLDPVILSNSPKPVIGFSDLTALLTFLRQRAGFPTFYGPVVTHLGKAKEETTNVSLLRALTSPTPLGQMPMGSAKTLKEGAAKGRVVGGCLSLINSSIGTPYELDADGCILFIEETREKVYVLDRMLTQLKNNGMMGKTKAIIFGSIIPLEDEPHSIETMITDVLSDFHGPVVIDYPAGHVDDFVTIPFGAEAEVVAEAGKKPSLSYTMGLLT